MKILNLKSKILNLKKGFTTIELVVAIVILSVLATVAIASFYLQKQRTDMQGAAQEAANVLRLAQSKTLASSDGSQYGIYFDISVSPNRYILFKGSAYALRDAIFDVVYLLPDTMEFSSISLGGGNEIVFDRLTGATSQSGNFSLRMKLNQSQSETVYISNSGSVGFSVPATPSDDDRLKDSRHIHFDYNRPNFVNCPSADAILFLYFDNASSEQQAVSICDNLSAGQLSWKGNISVNGSDQTIEIKTHYLQDASYPNGTQFSLRRDGRFNDKSLKITISGDDSGYLANYSADGLTTTYASIYVSNFEWQ